MAELFAADPALQARPGSPLRLPRYFLAVSNEDDGGWRSAAIIRDAASPHFFLRSVTVYWPFVVARPRPSSRQNEVIVPPERLSPARTTPAQKLVVNWDWQPRDGGAAEELNFFVRCRGPLLFWPKRRLALHLGLKQQAPPNRRYPLKLVTPPIDWRPQTESASDPLHLFTGHR